MPTIRTSSSLACWNLTSSTSARISHERSTTPSFSRWPVRVRLRGRPGGVDRQHRRQRVGPVQRCRVADQHRGHAPARQGHRDQQGIHDPLVEQAAQHPLDRFQLRRLVSSSCTVVNHRLILTCHQIAPTPFSGFGPLAFSAATMSVTVSAKYCPSLALIQRSHTRSGSKPICSRIDCRMATRRRAL